MTMKASDELPLEGFEIIRVGKGEYRNRCNDELYEICADVDIYINKGTAATLVRSCGLDRNQYS